MVKILCAGEALVDVVVGTDGQIIGEQPGGSVFNVACGLARLGVDATLASWWGADSRGANLEAAAARAGLRIFPGSNGAGHTTAATAHLDASGAATYDFDLEWDLPSGFGIDALANPGEVDATAVAPHESTESTSFGHLHLGSYSTLIQPGAAKILALLEAKAQVPHLTVSYDPNMRPALVEDVAAARAAVENIVARVDVVKASDEDLEFLYPGAEPAEIAAKWLASGPQLMIVTRGGAGAELYTPALLGIGGGGDSGAGASPAPTQPGQAVQPGQSAPPEFPGKPAPLRVVPTPVTVADTIGAGDSFMAGLLAALAEREALGAGRGALAALDARQLQECLAFAAATAAVTVAHTGPYAPTRSEIQ